MKPILVASVLDGTVLFKCVRVKTGVLNGKGVINNQLRRYNGINERRITTFFRDGVSQTGEINQCCLPKDVVADHPRRKPGKVEFAFTFNNLHQRVVQ